MVVYASRPASRNISDGIEHVVAIRTALRVLPDLVDSLARASKDDIPVDGIPLVDVFREISRLWCSEALEALQDGAGLVTKTVLGAAEVKNGALRTLVAASHVTGCAAHYNYAVMYHNYLYDPEVPEARNLLDAAVARALAEGADVHAAVLQEAEFDRDSGEMLAKQVPEANRYRQFKQYLQVIITLARSPLWKEDAPASLQGQWSQLRQSLTDWRHYEWVHWYESRLLGAVVDEDAELNRIGMPSK